MSLLHFNKVPNSLKKLHFLRPESSTFSLLSNHRGGVVRIDQLDRDADFTD